jgi:GNAT superfamily N-acetyltransferase
MTSQKVKFKKSIKKSNGVKIEILDGHEKIGRAFLYLIYNDLHKKPYGLMEDVFVKPRFRGQGWGTKIIKEIIRQAKRQGCYKLIGTSRFRNAGAQRLYQRLGFQKHGVEFRMDL